MRTTSSARLLVGDLHMRDDGAVLLRQPGVVERPHPLPSRCAAIARIAPDVTMPPPPMPANRPRHGLAVDGMTGCCRPAANSPSRACQCGSASGAPGGPATVTKLGQKPFRHDRSTLQLVGLIRRLRPSERLHRLDRDAAGLRGAVAAVLAHLLVDHDALRRLRHLAALAAAALFGGADLVVDQHRDAFVFAQLALHGVEVGAHMRASRRPAAPMPAAGDPPRRRPWRCAGRLPRRSARRAAAR